METTILSGIIKEVITSLGTAGFKEIGKLACVKREIRNLIITFGSIDAQIRDADRIVAMSEATDNLLKHLREYAYEAENIIDLFRIELGAPQEPRPQGWRCCRDVGIRCKAAIDIEELNKKLKRITPPLIQVVPREEETGETSYVGPNHDESSAVGRNIANECYNLVRILEEGTSQRDERISCAVVGPAGVGKTTLARKIYHDTRNTFGTRLWVHCIHGSNKLSIWLGDRPDSVRIEEGRDPREVLRGQLANARNSSRVLLVIDNVWEENGWDQFLQADFSRGGNALLVTTRHEDTARVMAVARRHRVDRLSEDDGWMLLHRMANLHAAAGGFEDIGRKIVQKCSGLPVALRWIGNDLRERTDQNIWEKVYECDFFGKYSQIHSCIDASYKRLSFVLKRCFLYCLLYPEESVIQKQCIVQQWIAEGFFSLAASQEGEAERCYEALIDRCLLLPEDNGHGEPGAKMPKLFRLFAIHKSQHENYVNNPRDIRTIFKPWRLSITSGYSVQDIPDEATSLRSLFLFGSPLNNGTALEFIFNKLTSLRVLDLRDTQVDTISNNLERLRQLRYLNLSGTRIQSLPESIGNLTVLQFLILKNCTRLESLPRRVGRLRKLRSLDISGTPKLNGVRFNLEQLTQLNCLQGFIPATSAPGNNGNGWKFEDLRHLGNLTSLQMVKLDTALSTTEDQNQLILDGQPHLRELELIWCRCSPADPQSRNRELETRVFGKLKPAGCLVSLKIVNYCGNGFASWLSSSYLTELQRLTLDGCLPSLDLPTLGQMINLKFLAITASNINQPPREERNDVAFPQLEQLILGRMESLQAWSGLQERDLPMLRVFQLDGCQRELTSIPSWLQSCRELTSMKIQNAGTLQEIADLPSLKELEVHNCSRLERISNIIRLDDLKIFNCSGLEAVNDVPFLCSVHLELQGAQLPRWLQPFNLRRLDITGTQELLNICSSPFSPCWSIIQGVADHVCGKKLGDDSIHFSYNKSTGSLYTSPRCAQRIAVPGLHNSATVRQDNWRAWKHNTFYAILLIATCSLVYLANF